MTKICSVICSLLTLLMCLDSAYGQSPQFEPLKSRYLSIRNTDVEVRKMPEWERLAEELLQFVTRNPKDSNAPLALLDAAILLKTLHEKRGNAHFANQAVRLLKTLERDYPESELADDGMFIMGEVLTLLGERQEALATYSSLVERYPTGDSLERAHQRIRMLKGEKLPVTPSEADSVPREAPLIVIDPGHGGEDFGSKSPSGLAEKNLVLDMAKRLESLLRKKKLRVQLTRREDVFVPLAERTALANELNATLFISLHGNASPGGKASGFEVFYLDNSGDEASRKLAERENASLRFEDGDSDIQFILSDLIQNAKLDDSIVLANLINLSVTNKVKERWKTAKSLGVRKAPFYVLVGAHMPCVLVELFFLDNVEDSAMLSDNNFRQDLVLGLYQGIEEFLRRTGHQL